MANKQEIAVTIQQASDLVKQTYAGMSEQRSQTRVADGGWTVKEVLSHMAGRKPAYERLLRAARDNTPPYSGNLDPDATNAALVDARRDKPVEELVAELLAVHEWLIGQVQALSDMELTKPITLPRGTMPLGDLLRLAAGTHTLNHMQDVQRALSEA